VRGPLSRPDVVGDFDCDDLVVGSPGESLGADETASSIVIIPGSRSGLNTAKTVSYHQDSPGVPGSAEDYDRFGETLAAGTTSSGKPYLLVGTPEEDLDEEDQGVVYYFRDSVWRTISQDTAGISGSTETDDGFGTAISVVSYRSSSTAAISALVAVGVPSEALVDNRYERAGTAHLINVTASGRSPNSPN